MNENQEMGLQHRIVSPFDATAICRVRRMGLIADTGLPDQDMIMSLSRVYAGQLFDDYCDFFQDADCAQEILKQFVSEAEEADPKERFIRICLQYDTVYQSLPDPVWWISGNADLVELFSAGFVGRMKQLLEVGSEGGTP